MKGQIEIIGISPVFRVRQIVRRNIKWTAFSRSLDNVEEGWSFSVGGLDAKGLGAQDEIR